MLTKASGSGIIYKHSYLKTAGKISRRLFVRPAEEGIAKFE